ncbi:MAG: hypothetical protein AAGD11_04690 [Planctomycetota bacterium]
MIACPLCLKKLPSYRPDKWDHYYRCPCGARFDIRCRHALPHFASLGLRKCDPIRLPPPNEYFAYRTLLHSLFAALRTRCDENLRGLARAYLPICDLIRFGDKHPKPIHGPDGKTIFHSQTKELWMSPNQCSWLDIGDMGRFHSNCDFASWSLERIGDGRFTDEEASSFGYVYQHFPHVKAIWIETPSIATAWKQAMKGQLPSSRRAQVRDRLPW